MGKLYYDWYKSHGICVDCGREKAAKGKTRCLVCLSINAEKAFKYRASLNEERQAEEKRRVSDKKKRIYHDRKAQGLCPYCGRQAENGKMQCDRCRAKNRLAAERSRRARGIKSQQVICEDETICSTCKKPVKPGYKVCERCYDNIIRAGKTGQAHCNRKASYWVADNRIVFGGVHK